MCEWEGQVSADGCNDRISYSGILMNARLRSSFDSIGEEGGTVVATRRRCGRCLRNCGMLELLPVLVEIPGREVIARSRIASQTICWGCEGSIGRRRNAILLSFVAFSLGGSTPVPSDSARYAPAM